MAMHLIKFLPDEIFSPTAPSNPGLFFAEVKRSRGIQHILNGDTEKMIPMVNRHKGTYFYVETKWCQTQVPNRASNVKNIIFNLGFADRKLVNNRHTLKDPLKHHGQKIFRFWIRMVIQTIFYIMSSQRTCHLNNIRHMQSNII